MTASSMPRRHLERLRKLTGGVLGNVPGSVPVSASRNGGFAPSSVPVIESTPYRAPVEGDFPTPPGGGSGGPDFPRWDWNGLVNATGPLVAWPLDDALTLTEVAIVMMVNARPIEFNVTQNGSTVDSIVCAATQFQTFTLTPSLTGAADDLVNIDITDVDTGIAVGLHIVLRA